jgi:putative ABC transport system permease protein
MLRTRWYKVLIDLWTNRTQTLIVALAVAVGVYAVGVVINTREMLVREYKSDQDGALMGSSVIYTTPFDDDLAQRMAEVPGVAAAEGRSVVRTHVQDSSGKQRDLVLISIPDFNNMQVDTITPLSGKWPPGKRQVILERLVLDYLGVKVGDSLVVQLDDGSQKTLTVVGTAHDAQKLDPRISSSPTGYVTPVTMEALGLGTTYTELHIRVAELTHDKAHIQAVADQVGDQLERAGRPVLSRRVITESIADPFIDTIVFILSSFGVIILLLSGFLVVNAISALITQQIPQIGVMKLIGGRRRQIMSLYIATTLVYGVIAITLGIPLGILTAQLLMKLLVQDVLNVKIDSLATPLLAVMIQAAVGLLLPLLAGLAPVIKGTSITIHKALNDVGMEAGNLRQGWLEPILGRLQKLLSFQRPTVLAIRNTVRHKGRLVQTLVVLIVGTSLFISVISVWSSVNATVESFMRYHHYDVSITMEQPYRIARLEQVAGQVPGIVAMEGWSEGAAIRKRPDGTESGGIRVSAMPAQTDLMAPQLSAGRWLAGGRRNEIVVNSDAVEDEPDIRVGSDVVLDIGGREATWHVVGLVPTESRGAAIYMDSEDYAYASRTAGLATELQVVTQRHDSASQEKMETLLRQQLEASGLDVGSTTTTQILRQENTFLFTIIVGFLVLMALLLAAVGGLGLTTTMSINILERVREVGVLRAIGASSTSVRKIVLMEGVAIGIVSWVVGMLLSLPIGRFMSKEMGLALIQVPLIYHYATTAALAWFVVLQIIAVAASLGPARKAVRLTIREVLAYE